MSKQALTRVLHAVGLHVGRYHPRMELVGIDPYSDVRRLLAGVQRPVVFDVGAFGGDTVEVLRDVLPRSEIHAFEPSPTTFQSLEATTRGLEGVHAVNAAVGSSVGTATLVENDHVNLSSLLQPGETAWGRVVRETPVDLTTLDDYSARRGVERVDLLKTDTQGYELEVLRGAAGLIAAGRVRLVYTEVIFSQMYEGMAPFDELYRFLREHDFELVAFYNVAWQNERASWCDALFAARG